MRRVVGWTFVVVLAVSVPAVLWWLSSMGVSPEQRVADAEPPPPPVVEVVVEERELSDVVVFRGLVSAVDSIPVEAPELDGVSPVVVDLPVSVGTEVVPGDLVAVVADRPVFVLDMPVGLYRSLTPGVEGEDVIRLQEALLSLGYEVDIDGLNGPKTQGAVADFYADRGFEAADSGEETRDALQAADEEVRQARLGVEDARRGGDPTLVSRARDALRLAEQAQAKAAARVGVVVPLGEMLGVTGFPAVVSSVDVAVGEVADGSLLSLTTSGMVVDAAVDSSLGAFLAPGVEAVGEDEWRLVVLSNDGRDDTGRTIVRLGAVESLPADRLGRDIRVEAILAATDGPVVAVPITAVRSRDDGEFVRVANGDGTWREVGVVTGVSIGGWVEILGSGEELPAGTLVRLG